MNNRKMVMRGGWVDTYRYMRKAAIRQNDPAKLAEVEKFYKGKAIAAMNTWKG